jgi:hypothetical protein
LTKRLGKHAESFHDLKVRGIHPKQVQPDEAWSFVGKKTRTANLTGLGVFPAC